MIVESHSRFVKCWCIELAASPTDLGMRISILQIGPLKWTWKIMYRSYKKTWLVHSRSPFGNCQIHLSVIITVNVEAVVLPGAVPWLEIDVIECLFLVWGCWWVQSLCCFFFGLLCVLLAWSGYGNCQEFSPFICPVLVQIASLSVCLCVYACVCVWEWEWGEGRYAGHSGSQHNVLWCCH